MERAPMFRAVASAFLFFLSAPYSDQPPSARFEDSVPVLKVSQL
jgi:hypothetical protein